MSERAATPVTKENPSEPAVMMMMVAKCRTHVKKPEDIDVVGPWLIATVGAARYCAEIREYHLERLGE